MTDTKRQGGSPARRPARSRAGGDAGLSPDAIVDRALEVTQRGGTAALTVRRLGAELGVDPTALYRPFRDKDVLGLACMDRAVQFAVDSLVSRADRSTWQMKLRAVAAE